MDQAFCQHFAHAWISAWNAHDLDQILAHYSDDFVMTSPFIISIAGDATGTLHGKAAVADYWADALTRIPDLHFELHTLLTGVDSLTLYYTGVGRRLSAETLHFNADGKVQRAYAHYASA